MVGGFEVRIQLEGMPGHPQQIAHGLGTAGSPHSMERQAEQPTSPAFQAPSPPSPASPAHPVGFPSHAQLACQWRPLTHPMAPPGMLLATVALLATWWGSPADPGPGSALTGTSLEDEVENQENILLQDDNKPVGGFSLRGCLVSALEDNGVPTGVKGNVQGNLFKIITKNDIHYYIQASSKTERANWIEAIKPLT